MSEGEMNERSQEGRLGILLCNKIYNGVLRSLMKFIIVHSQSMESDPNQQDILDLDQEDVRLTGHQPLNFDWKRRWLKGHEYAYILRNINAYCQRFGFSKYEFKKHPPQIYENPINGTIYFVQGNGVGSDFGFPRVAAKKKYRWKKMNFTTDLPKKKPYVTYVVASAMKSQQIEQPETPEFRMHAVIPYKENQGETNNSGFILCHVREVDQKKEPETMTLESCFVGGYTDFYRLLAHLHNLQNDWR